MGPKKEHRHAAILGVLRQRPHGNLDPTDPGVSVLPHVPGTPYLHIRSDWVFSAGRNCKSLLMWVLRGRLVLPPPTTRNQYASESIRGPLSTYGITPCMVDHAWLRSGIGVGCVRLKEKLEKFREESKVTLRVLRTPNSHFPNGETHSLWAALAAVVPSY